MKRLRVWLGDLRHDTLSVLSTDTMPLGIGNMKAVMDRDFPEAESRIFAYPSVLLNALKENPPDVLMLSNYMWNEALSTHFIQLFKNLNPAGLAIMGGPNFPLDQQRFPNFFQSKKGLDLYVTGEADFLATEIAKGFEESNRTVKKFLEQEYPASFSIPEPGFFRMTEIPLRKKQLDEIPSPWLKGIMDPFFDGRLVPLFETNRGCPFSCSFCVQGTDYYNKVNFFSEDRIKEELIYIAKKGKEKAPGMKLIRLADPNFGMYKRDAMIAGWMGETQKKFEYPGFIDATTGKNNADRIIQAVENANGAMVVYQAVQSLDEDVLKNIKRDNISLEAYRDIQVYVQGRGLRSSSDLIMALPGETLTSHLKAIFDLIDAGTHSVTNFQAMVLKGSEMDTDAYRKQFAFKTKFRLLPKNFGEYDGQVFDTEEIVTETNSFSFEDYLIARKYHFILSLFWNESRFSELIKLLGELGIKPSDWVSSLAEKIIQDESKIGQLFKSFLLETQNELFSSKEDAIEFYSRPENYRRLLRNECGDNLIYRYRGIASFRLWDQVCAYVIKTTNEMDAIRDQPLIKKFIRELVLFQEKRHAWGRKKAQILGDSEAAFSFDIIGWIQDGMPVNVENFQFEKTVTIRFSLSGEGRQNLESALKFWNPEESGLVMLVRAIQNSWQRKEATRLNQAKT